VKKDIFGKWKKEEATTGYEDDHQHPESRIILERMASIITSDEAKKKESRADFNVTPEASTSDSLIVIDNSEASAQDTTSILETSEDNLFTINDSVTNILPLIQDKAVADGNQISTDPHDKSEYYNREPIQVENITAPSTSIKKKGSPVILVVEDEPVTQRLLKKILEDRGYEVVIAGDGIDALMELGKKNFDLMLSDLSMPNLDGFKLLDFINMKRIKTPIIFLTGSDDVEDEIKVLALGAKDYIRKPLNRDLLLLRVGKVLQQ
jgi:CheY-like chemotaxis protein